MCFRSRFGITGMITTEQLYAKLVRRFERERTYADPSPTWMAAMLLKASAVDFLVLEALYKLPDTRSESVPNPSAVHEN